MQNFGQLGLKNCVCFLHVFSLYFPFFFFFFFFFFYSWPDLNKRLYPHNAPNLLASSRKGFTGDDMFGGQG